MLPVNARTRKIYDEPGFTGYEVMLDVFPDVFAAGIILVPRGMKEGERRPVVVCQHGLEGRPADVADPKKDHPAYHRYAVKLAERGFITYAPQNPYIFGDRFRVLQRKANPLKKSLFSIIVPQHQQTVDWLASLPMVDGSRIAFYGLSYGGKTAMRVPPLVKGYCLSICSADFNEWVWKNTSTRSPYSYVPSIEYEMVEWNLGNTFNYAEMAALIAPRPFMVERGHRDGVGAGRVGRVRIRQGAPALRRSADPQPHAHRVLRRAPHDSRRRHVRVPARAPEMAESVRKPTAVAGSRQKSEWPFRRPFSRRLDSSQRGRQWSGRVMSRVARPLRYSEGRGSPSRQLATPFGVPQGVPPTCGSADRGANFR